MRHTIRSAVTAVCLLGITTVALAQETSFAVTGRYTAQRKPRVTVLEFENTNANAQGAKYGASVQAMLVTFLKRKSQFVVVERQKLGDVVAEWQRNQRGMTNLLPEDPTARELLEKIDAIIIGNVTLLDAEAEAETTGTSDEKSGVKRSSRSGGKNGEKKIIRDTRIEIDAKLLSRADGRIIAAAQRSGPVVCLRSIVERLGIALEQEFLRPYYGKVKITLTDPENVQVFLTPILLDTALDEEKPPIERGATVRIGNGRDMVEPWTTDPTTYTIENLLSGWYSMRLERPGYEGLGTENSRWEGHDSFGRVQIYDRTTSAPIQRVPGELSRFVVRVDPLTTEVIDGDHLKFLFRKKGGTISPRVKRQHLDNDFVHSPKRILLVGDELEINELDRPEEYEDDDSCDLFDEEFPNPADYGRTYLASGQTFDFDTFKGGQLVIEDYRGETLPVGQYRMTLWEPQYRLYQGSVSVRDRDREKLVRSNLERETGSITFSATGPRPSHKVVLQGQTTRHRAELPLNFESDKTQPGLPVDTYLASTSIPGLEGWQRRVDLPARNVSPPIFDLQEAEEEIKEEKAKRDREEDTGEDEDEEEEEPELPEPKIPGVEEEGRAKPAPTLRVKTRLAIGGRLQALSTPPEAIDTQADLYIDARSTEILDLLLYGGKKPEPERGGAWLDIVAGVGQDVLKKVSAEMLQRAGSPQEKLAAKALNALLNRDGTSQEAVAGVGEDALRQLAAKVMSKAGSAEEKVAIEALLSAALDMTRARHSTPGSPAPAALALQPPPGTASPGTAGAAAPPVPPEPQPAPLPTEPEALRALLATHLEDLDLLVLDNQDMARLQSAPEIARLVERYLSAGGALFAYVSESGEYGDFLGAPLQVKRMGKPTDQFALALGEVSTLSIQLDSKRKVQVKSKRILPELTRLDRGGPWRVLAFGRGHKDPRIIERGFRDQGGYVAVWCDDPVSFRGRRGGTVPEVESVRARVEKHVLDWARNLMLRRYDKAGSERLRAEQALIR